MNTAGIRKEGTKKKNIVRFVNTEEQTEGNKTEEFVPSSGRRLWSAELEVTPLEFSSYRPNCITQALFAGKKNGQLTIICQMLVEL